MLVVIAIAFAALGFAAASWLRPGTEPAVPATQTVDDEFDRGASVEQRLAALEQAVTDERAARQLLEEELIFLLNDRQEDAPPAARVAADAAATTADTPVQRRASRAARNSREERTRRLVDAGFDTGRAEWIVSRESELQMEALQARYDARRNGTMNEYFRRQNGSLNALRTELGDNDYERYLVANGRSTNVSITNVLDSSPAQSAGLRTGDRIVSYGGTRIFSMFDLTEQIVEGTPGERVVIDILRDGAPMQVVVPRGPVGITGGR